MTMQLLRTRVPAAVLMAAMLAACGEGTSTMTEPQQQPDNTLMRVITGEVWYRERIALPRGAEVIVTLEDQSRADAPATVITDYTHRSAGQPPYSFRLVYDPAAIDERMTYGLRARIVRDGELLFTSTEYTDPFSDPPVRIMVTRVNRGPGE